MTNRIFPAGGIPGAVRLTDVTGRCCEGTREFSEEMEIDAETY